MCCVGQAPDPKTFLVKWSWVWSLSWCICNLQPDWASKSYSKDTLTWARFGLWMTSRISCYRRINWTVFPACSWSASNPNFHLLLIFVSRFLSISDTFSHSRLSSKMSPTIKFGVKSFACFRTVAGSFVRRWWQSAHIVDHFCYLVMRV